MRCLSTFEALKVDPHWQKVGPTYKHALYVNSRPDLYSGSVKKPGPLKEYEEYVEYERMLEDARQKEDEFYHEQDMVTVKVRIFLVVFIIVGVVLMALFGRR